MSATTQPVDELLPVPRLAVLGLQHVLVMYAGAIVEEGTADDIFYRPAHPYTQGLLASLPDPAQKDKALTGIPGQAPDLFHMPEGCRFYPRCPQAMKACTERTGR